jgi:hypothetical protein
MKATKSTHSHHHHHHSDPSTEEKDTQKVNKTKIKVEEQEDEQEDETKFADTVSLLLKNQYGEEGVIYVKEDIEEGEWHDEAKSVLEKDSNAHIWKIQCDKWIALIIMQKGQPVVRFRHPY